MALQQQPLHEAVVVHARLTGHEEVVAGAGHGQRKLDGSRRSCLPEGGIPVGQLGRCPLSTSDASAEHRGLDPGVLRTIHTTRRIQQTARSQTVECTR